MAEQLQNAPLIEVVFEMRWEGSGGGPEAPMFDPGYPELQDAFSDYAMGVGFQRALNTQSSYFGLHGSVVRRFYQDERPFPILQIGPGVFASNASAEYDWDTFKDRTIEAAAVVVAKYPKLNEHKLNIVHVQLRYIDMFDENVALVTDLVTFLREATNLTFELPSFWNEQRFGKERRGRLLLDVDLLKPIGAKFYLDIASAERDDSPVIRLETKVVSEFTSVLSSSPRQFKADLGAWLEFAHGVTSPAFRELIRAQALEKFK